MTGDFHTWSQTAQGAHALRWQLQQYERSVCDVFGYQAVQLALPQGVPFAALAANRIPCQTILAMPQVAPTRTTEQASSTHPVPQPAAPPHVRSCPASGAAVTSNGADVWCDFAALPLQSDSLDLLLCPHTLERSHDPHATLREVQRVLRPQGVVILSGLQLLSAWNARAYLQKPWQKWCAAPCTSAHKPHRFTGFLPEHSVPIHWARLRDWLQLLHLELCSVEFFGYSALCATREPCRLSHWTERTCKRLWPSWGAVYFAVAIKRVHGVRLLEPNWSHVQPLRAAGAPARSHTASAPVPSRTVCRPPSAMSPLNPKTKT